MASLTYADGRGTVQFTDGDGMRRTVRLGRTNKRDAEAATAFIGKLAGARAVGAAPDRAAGLWAAGLGDTLHARLARVGLVAPRETHAVTLGELLTRFEESADVQPVTRAAYKQTTGSLRKHFGGDRLISKLTPGDADGWRKVIVDEGLAAATVAKRVIVAKEIFRRAIRWGLLETSPFADLRAGPQHNADRKAFVSLAAIDAVLEACPTAEWNAIVGLARLAGLRCPSEIALLRWGDVDFSAGRLCVRSPKTARHEGHAVRFVPMVPALKAILLRAFDAAEVGAEFVAPRLGRSRGQNLRTTFTKIITQAGMKPWPKLLNALRSSCETDWCDRFPGHVVASWMGHSPLIAARHYLQTRDAHFEAASRGGEALQKALHQAPVSERKPQPAETENVDNQRENAQVGASDSTSRLTKVGPAGLEPATSGL